MRDWQEVRGETPLQFSKVSWDGDANVETTGRSFALVAREFQIWLPLVLRGGLWAPDPAMLGLGSDAKSGGYCPTVSRVLSRGRERGS